jgi:hypothetical protein
VKARQNEVIFPCGDLNLEGISYFPEGDGFFPAVVVCHPHPVYGGSMNNNVTMAISSALAGRSIIVLMFNFRGVGGSQGSFGGGVAEQEDVKAALSWIAFQAGVDANKMALAGYSFGAAVALPVACSDARVKAMALISPPLEQPQGLQLRDCTKPKLVICGSEDYLVLPMNVDPIMREAAEPKQFEVIDGADHFWWSFEKQMAEKVAEFFSRSFNIASQ